MGYKIFFIGIFVCLIRYSCAGEYYYSGKKLVEIDTSTLSAPVRYSDISITHYFGKLRKSGMLVVGTGEIKRNSTEDILEGCNVYLLKGNGQKVPLDETRSLVQVLVSPREDKLAGITRENQLVVVDLQGNQKVLKTDNHPVTQGSWSPDGKFLVYVGWPENWKYSTRLNARTLDELHAAMNSNLYILDIESGEITQLTHSIKENYNPIWSPDGKTILFISLRTNYASYFRIDADGTGETQLTNINHETHPIRIPVATSDKISWNPQGTVLVYETCMKPKENTIWTIQPDGINPTKLGLGTYPQWSENGQDVVYTTPDNNIQVWNTVSGKPAGMMKVTP